LPRGTFITLEGGEGSGKSTVAAELARRLRETGHDVTLTEEPGGTELGQRFWSYLRDPAKPPLAPLAELFWFEAARAQHVEQVIRPALAAGGIVVCDRYGDSSVAYQGCGRGLGRELVESLNGLATGGLKPDLTLLLDVAVDAGLARARRSEGKGGAKKPDAIGSETAEFHQRVRDGFLAIASQDADRVVVIDASQPLEGVIEEAWRAVENALKTAG
jgi:dTMP kinase